MTTPEDQSRGDSARGPGTVGFQVRSVLLAAKFSIDDEDALYHAIRIVLGTCAKLWLFHFQREHERSRLHMIPRVRRVLQDWRRQWKDGGEGGCETDHVEEVFAVHVDTLLHRGHLSTAVAGFVSSRLVDLVVMSSHFEVPFWRVLAPWRARKVGREIDVPFLVLPLRTAGFVSPTTGESVLNRVLVVISGPMVSQLPFVFLKGLLHALDGERAIITILWIAPENIELGSQSIQYALDGCKNSIFEVGSFTRRHFKGFIEKVNPDLLVLETKGHHSWDVVGGRRIAEKILAEAFCPVLFIPEWISLR